MRGPDHMATRMGSGTALPTDELDVELLEAGHHRSPFAATHGGVVVLHDRGEAGEGPGDKGLIGGPDVLGGGAGNRVVFSYRVVRGVRIRDLLGSASARRRVNFMFRSRFAGG